jgi:hypothetical protein
VSADPDAIKASTRYITLGVVDVTEHVPSLGARRTA